jgi:two-component system alkaline phosphatase synthesis response regulator PhoP
MAQTVLLVEDDEMISSMYKTKLTQGGYEVLVADNGHDGFETAVKKRPDIVLLDIILPQMDGFSVLEELRSRKEPRTYR